MKWRTLIRFISTDLQSQIAMMIIPGWDPHKVIHYPMNKIQPMVVEKLTPQSRFHARVDLGASSVEELDITDWEL